VCWLTLELSDGEEPSALNEWLAGLATPYPPNAEHVARTFGYSRNTVLACVRPKNFDARRRVDWRGTYKLATRSCALNDDVETIVLTK
jgi:hypothetical protein